MMSEMEPFFIKVLNMSLTAGIVICVVVLMRVLLRRAPKIFSYILWAVVLFRLLCPVSFSSAMSFFNILRVPSTQQGGIMYISENIGFMEQPSVDLTVPAIEDAVNASLPAADAAGSVNPMQIVLWAGVCIWMSGIAIMTLCALISYLKLRGKLKQAVWEQENIYHTAAIETPFVCGFFVPRIYLPVQFASDRLSEAGQKEKSYILLHEQIHIKRGDYIWRVIGYLALCIHWFNPLVWLAFSLSEKDMEMSCDEAVVRKLGGDVKKEYSASLLSFASGRRIRLNIPLAFGERETGSRIKNVLRYQKPAQIVIGVAALVCVVVIAVLAVNPGDAGSGNGTDAAAGTDNAVGADSVDNAGSMDAGADSAAEVYYGVVSYVDIEGVNREVVTIPGLGDVEIPEAEEVYPYIEIEHFTGPEAGDLLAITFPEGEEVSLQETYPSSFSIPAQSIAVMGQGFAIERTDSGTYRFTVPWGYAQEAKAGDMLAIYYYNDITADGISLATVPVISVDAGNYDIWVELSVDETKTFLANFGHGIECEIVESNTNQPENGINQQAYNRRTSDDALTGTPNELVPGMFSEDGIGDGIYRVYVRSVFRREMGIGLYFVEDEYSDELPFLAFSENCKFMVNREMETLRYEEVSFEEFADLTEEVLFFLKPSMILTFVDGQVTEAILENYYGAGISFASPQPDEWYGDEEMMRQMTAQENLDAKYTFEHQIYLDVGDSEGMERIEVYAGNERYAGDADTAYDTGIVLVKNAEEKNLFTSIYATGAGTFRTGWSNVYLGYMDNYGFIMALHIENNGDFGQYDYYVFRLAEDGTVQQIAGSAFYFDNRGIPYDDTLFAEWTKNLGRYLEKSELILSTQDGVLRTEMVSEADKYTYETLKPNR